MPFFPSIDLGFCFMPFFPSLYIWLLFHAVFSFPLRCHIWLLFHAVFPFPPYIAFVSCCFSLPFIHGFCFMPFFPIVIYGFCSMPFFLSLHICLLFHAIFPFI